MLTATAGRARRARPARPPTARMADSSSTHAHLQDEAGRLGDRDELAGGDQAPLRVLPAHERLDGHDLVGPQRHLGLVVQDQLAAVGGAPQRVLHLGPPQRARACISSSKRWMPRRPAASPSARRPRPGGAAGRWSSPGSADGRRRTTPSGTRSCRPRRRGREHSAIPRRQRHGVERSRVALRRGRRTPRRPSGRRCGRPEAAASRCRHRPRSTSPTDPPEPVVLLLEPVEAEEQQAHRPRLAAGAAQGQVEPVEEDRPVREAGELVLEDLARAGSRTPASRC